MTAHARVGAMIGRDPALTLLGVVSAHLIILAALAQWAHFTQNRYPPAEETIEVALVSVSPVPEQAVTMTASEPPRRVVQVKPPPPMPVPPPEPQEIEPQASPARILPAEPDATTTHEVPAESSAIEMSEPVSSQPAEETPPSFNAAYLSNPRPAYPNMSRRLGEEGRVLLRVLVGVDGRPLQVVINESSGFSRLDRAAQEAVSLQWRFVAAKRSGAPIEGWVIVPITFKLER